MKSMRKETVKSLSLLCNVMFEYAYIFVSYKCCGYYIIYLSFLFKFNTVSIMYVNCLISLQPRVTT